MIERSRVRIPAGTAGEFSSPGSTFCADSYFGIRSTPVLPPPRSPTREIVDLKNQLHIYITISL